MVSRSINVSATHAQDGRAASRRRNRFPGTTKEDPQSLQVIQQSVAAEG